MVAAFSAWPVFDRGRTGQLSKSEIEAALYGKPRGKARIAVCPPEDRTWIAPDGKAIVFASKHEMREYLKFHALQAAGLISNLRRQITYPLHAVTPTGFKVKITSYRADIVCEDREGKTCIYDPKGHITERYKLIKAWFEAEYGMRIVEL